MNEFINIDYFLKWGSENLKNNISSLKPFTSYVDARELENTFPSFSGS